MPHRSHEAFAPAVVFIAGLATILAAWGFQLILHYVPCALCLEERNPYYVGLPIVLVALLAALAGAKPTISRLFLMVGGLVFTVGVYLGTYHAGAEWGFWPGPTDCGGGTSLPTTTGDLIESLKHIRVVSCTEAAFRFPAARWGLSFAGANAVISLFLVVASFWGAFRPVGRDEPVAMRQERAGA